MLCSSTPKISPKVKRKPAAHSPTRLPTKFNEDAHRIHSTDKTIACSPAVPRKTFIRFFDRKDGRAQVLVQARYRQALARLRDFNERRRMLK